jgi:hypothetical protein
MADIGRAVLSNAAGQRTNAVNTPAPTAPELRPNEPKTEPPTPQPSHNGPHMPVSTNQWPPQNMDNSIDPRLQQQQPSPMPNLLNPMPAMTPGQHPTSSERADRAPIPAAFGFAEQSPDWLNFDAAFENFEGLLGSSGADFSNELFRPLNYETLEGFLDPATQ